VLILNQSRSIMTGRLNNHNWKVNMPGLLPVLYGVPDLAESDTDSSDEVQLQSGHSFLFVQLHGNGQHFRSTAEVGHRR